MIIGTAGHIDHGKTALVRALTGIDADRLPEEKARGITIDLGFAYRPLPDGGSLGFVDVPGHARFVHTMLAGAAGIDCVLLVVAADDGPMPQTVEHLQIVDLLGLTRGVVALTKADLASPARLEEVTAAIRALLAPTGLASAPILPVSALTGAGIPALEAALLAEAAALPARAAAGRFRLAIDRSFTRPGAGTVVTGTVVAGEVATGAQLTLTPAGLAARVRRIQAQNQAAETGRIGQRCALNLVGPGIDKDRIRRGDWLVEPALHRPTTRLDVRLRLLPSEPRPLRHWTPAHLHLGAVHVPARIALLDPETLAPGGSGLAQLVLERPIGALRGDRLILRDQSAQRTMAGGRVLDPWPPARGRRRPSRLAMLRALEEADPAAALRAVLAGEPGWVELASFALAWNLTPEEAALVWEVAEIRLIGPEAAPFGLLPARCADFATRVQETLRSHHERAPESAGLERERLRLSSQLRLPPLVFAALIEALLAERTLAADGPWLRLPGHQVKLAPADERLWAKLRPPLAAQRFQPPRVRDLATELRLAEDQVRQLLRRLARMGQVVQVAPDHFFLRPAVAEMTALAAELAAGPGLTAASFRDRIGGGRKVAIQILEFFDGAGVTQRQGDLRSVRPERSERFGRVG